VDKWDCIGGVYGKLSRAGSNDICLVLPLQSLAVLIVLVIREYSNKDCVEFGETCDEWAGKLLELAMIDAATVFEGITFRSRWNSTR
jgi:hypothetical protein